MYKVQSTRLCKFKPEYHHEISLGVPCEYAVAHGTPVPRECLYVILY